LPSDELTPEQQEAPVQLTPQERQV
jgi:hypothetical protein